MDDPATSTRLVSATSVDKLPLPEDKSRNSENTSEITPEDLPLIPLDEIPAGYGERSGSGEYVIQPGDQLDVKFRVTRDLNELVIVRPDGMISLQIVGDVPAAGLTAEQLRQELVAAYSKELKSPDIAVIVRTFSGHTVFVGGEVQSQGRFPLSHQMTILQAVILAGGFKDTADRLHVMVLRQGERQCFNLKGQIHCGQTGNDIPLEPYDVVYVPKSKIAKVNQFVDQYIEKVIPFQRSFGVFISHNTGLGSSISGAGP
ncbi:MAG TPA: polysaccharide biosynthesis/export family protein [Pirellulaceae bacterium]